MLQWLRKQLDDVIPASTPKGAPRLSLPWAALAAPPAQTLLRGARPGTFIGLWLSVVVLPNMLVPLVPKPEVVPNRLMLALESNGSCEGQVLSPGIKAAER